MSGLTRVRPLVWLVLLVSCVGVLVFAATVREDIAAVMRVHIEQRPVAGGVTTIELQLSDPEGVPIDGASVFSQANMTNMPMGMNASGIHSMGQGNYAIQLHFSMTGPWLITVQAHADGFEALNQTLLVQVEAV